MKITLYLIGLIILIVGCNPSPTPTTSGVEGQVLIGPMCPVMQIGQPCPDQPYQARLSIFRENGQKVVSFQTGVDGSFRLALAPGDYILRLESPGGMPYAEERPFSIHANQYTRLTVSYDSGIR